MSDCQCRPKLLFASALRQFNWKLDRSDLFSLTKNLEYGLRKEGLLSFVRELNGNELNLREASIYTRDFHGVTGHVHIDDNGDRDANYSILDLDPINGKFAVVVHYYGLHRLAITQKCTGKDWPGGREEPPPDIEKCGFFGNSPEYHGNGWPIFSD
uniref:Uncharacterized protein n=1 Tax=Glossina brevipalpis TaxID=37001 RepID=A0A1A9WQW4_9MUSC